MKRPFPVLYPLLDPSLEEALLLNKLEEIVAEEIAAVQIWDNFPPGSNVLELTQKICAVCQRRSVPVLINNRWNLLAVPDLSGVHFDELPTGLDLIRRSVGRSFVTGVTCSNDLSVLRQAMLQQVDYISFCSVFPSCTSNSCELVQFDTIREARKLTSMPVFLAGGIRPENIHLLRELDFDGVAIVSGILQSATPGQAIQDYHHQLETFRK